MTDSSQRLLRCNVSLVYINFLVMLLWNASSDFKFQSSASQLPEDEVSSLNTMIKQLKTKPNVANNIDKRYCDHPVTNSYYSIKCINGSRDHYSHISEITFSGSGLTGTIDASVGDLSGLTSIDLSNNKLQGSIPYTLGNLIHLETLDLSLNNLSGNIPPHLGNLKSLTSLYLGYNFLSGAIPLYLGKLSRLEDMSLGLNMLSGSIPKTFSQLKNLINLDISENRLTGELPSELGNLTKLEIFYMESNYLQGKLPNYENLTSLQVLVLAGNQFSGPLPSYLDKWPELQYLVLQGNNFQGPLPAEYFRLANLLHLSITDLTDTSYIEFPAEANLPNITRLVLRSCRLTGPIPRYIADLSTLEHLDLSFNGLTGPIPETTSSNFIFLSLARNYLNGSIPNWVLESTASTMDLSYNNFSKLNSPVPAGLDLNLFACCCCETTKPHMLQPVDMMNYYFPKDKSKFHSLFINAGGGQIDHERTSYVADNDTSMQFHISPAHNWAYSFSRDYIGENTNSSDYIKKVHCRISNTQTPLYDDARLSPVALDYYGFSLQNGPYNVTLHFAEIVFVDDVDYGSLRKRLFDIYIQGKLERKDFNIRDEAGGPNVPVTLPFTTDVKEHILDIHLRWTGKGTYSEVPFINGPLISAISVSPLFEVGHHFKAWQIALIVVASLVVVLLLFLALAWLMGWLRNKELQEKVKVGEYFDNGLMKDITVLLKELVKATENFSKRKRIGESGFLGSVYKAEVLKPTHITVAVKRFHPRYKGKLDGFIRKEIGHMTKLEGENIVKLLDVHIGQTLQLLIYEYMENESLEAALFHAKVETIPWEKRLEICLGVAKGLESLHYHPGKIVHGNIKASNILLDREYKPKLSDFGFASVYTNEEQFSLIKQEAPRGYLAHEYCQGDNPTFKTDIYSFGVLLVEIVAGKKNKEVKAEQETRDLVNEVHKHFKENRTNIRDLVDRKFAGDLGIDEQAEEILRLAVKCTSMPSLRPDISEVVRVLNGVNKKAGDKKWSSDIESGPSI